MCQRALALAASAAISFGCAPEPRGRFKLLSTRIVPNQYVAVFYPRVEGQACFDPIFSKGENGLQLALSDALSKRPEADALTLAEFRFDGTCFKVEGTPAKLK